MSILYYTEGKFEREVNISTALTNLVIRTLLDRLKQKIADLKKKEEMRNKQSATLG